MFATQRMLVSLTIATVISSTGAFAADAFEVATSKAVYITREGISPGARPAFEIQARSFASIRTDARSQLLARELALSIGPRESVMRPLRLGERAILMQVSEPKRVSLLKRIPLSAATMTAGVVAALFVTNPALLAVAGGAIVLADFTVPLEEIINSQLGRDDNAVRGGYLVVDTGGRVIPSAGGMVQRLPDGGVKDAASYVVRHVRHPKSASVLQGWFAAMVATRVFGIIFPSSGTLAKVVTREIEGKFVGDMVDLVVRDATSSSQGSEGGSCYTMPPLPGMVTSMPVLCRQTLTPSLQMAGPAPIVATSAQAIPLQIRALVPEVNAWFHHRAMAVRVIPVAPGAVMVLPNYESTSVPLHTVSPPNNLPPSNGEESKGRRQTSHEDKPAAAEKSPPGSHPRDQRLRGLPTGVHLKGGFGGFTLDRHE